MPKIDLHEHRLSNGLRVIICPDHSSSVVTVHVTYHVGSYDEDPSRTGLAHLFEHLMFDNTSTGISKQYDLYCTKAGGTNNAYTTYDHTAYHISLPAHQLELGLWLEAERMRMFSIDEQDLSTQQSVVLEEIKQNVENQPYMRWMPAMDKAAFATDSHYSWNVYGATDHVAAVTMEDASAFYHRYYRPGNAVLVVAGDCDPQGTLDLIQRIFGEISGGHAPIDRTPFDQSQRRTGVHVTERDAVPTSAVFVSVHGSSVMDPAMYDVDLAASLLGIGKSSYLYRHLVSKKRIASHAGAFVDRRTHDSLLTFYAYGIDGSVSADHLADEIHAAIDGVSVTDENMRKVVNRQRTALAMELQRSGGVADSVAYHATFFDDPGMVNDLLDRYAERPQEAVASVVETAKQRDRWVRVDIVPR